MHSVLIFYPLGLKGIKTNFPKMVSAINIHFVQKLPIHTSALYCCNVVLGESIAALNPEQKEKIKDEIMAVRWDEFMHQLSESMKTGSSRFGGQYTNGAISFGSAIATVIQWRDDELIERDELEMFMSEIIDSLRGYTPIERSRIRLLLASVEHIRPSPSTTAPHK